MRIVKQIVLSGVFFLAAVMFLSADYGDNPSLPKHFASADGIIEFDYPLWWALTLGEEDIQVNSILVSNSPSYLEEDVMEPGILVVGVLYGKISSMSDELDMQWPGAYDIHTNMLDDLGYYESDQYVVLNTEELYIDGKPAYMTMIGDYDADYLVITFESERNYCVFAANMYPGELPLHAPLVMQIAKTLKLR